jgi:hypothetical protein
LLDVEVIKVDAAKARVLLRDLADADSGPAEAQAA